MPRIPYKDWEHAHPRVRETMEGMPRKLNIFRMAANAETCFQPLMKLGGRILGRQKLDDKLREHAILLVAKLEGGEYEWIQHVPIAKAVGATVDQIAAIERGDLAAGCFDDTERAFLQFAKEVIENVRVSDATFAAAAEHLSPQEIVETIVCCGFYMTMARITEATQVELDEPGTGRDIVDSLA